MLKKYALFTMLGVMAVLSLSAFSSVGLQPVISNAFSLAPRAFLAPAAAVSDPSGGLTNFRKAQFFNGIYIPPMDVTGALAPAATSSNPSGGLTNFRKAQFFNGIYIPPMDVTGLLAPAASEGPQYAPASEIFSLVAVPLKFQAGTASGRSNFLPIARQYQYGPFSLAAGSRVIQRQYQYGPFPLAALSKWNSGH
jgi:hypothetical protein